MPFSLAAAASGLLGGYLVDRYNPKRVFTINLGLLIVTLILVNVGGTALALLYAVVHGLFQGVQMVISSTTWAYFYGRHGLGRVQGTGGMINIVASAIGPLPLARSTSTSATIGPD